MYEYCTRKLNHILTVVQDVGNLKKKCNFNKHTWLVMYSRTWVDDMMTDYTLYRRLSKPRPHDQHVI